MRRNISIPVTLLLCLVFYITCWQAIRFSTGIAWSDTLKAYEPHFMPLYIDITGAFWTLTGLFLLWSMWRGQTLDAKSVYYCLQLVRGLDLGRPHLRPDPDAGQLAL